MNKKLLFFIVGALVLPIFIFALDKIEINTASLEQLDKITSIGPVLAQRIIDARPFSSIDDLSKVSGIGEKTLQKIKDQGLACVNCSNYSNLPNYSNQTPNPNTQVNETTESDTPPASIVYPSGVYINEIMPNPEGSDEENEWIKLYNSNDFDVDLADWTIQDTNGTIKIYTIPKNTKIFANGFLMFKRPETKIMLNNDEDTVILKNPNREIASSLSFEKAKLGQTYPVKAINLLKENLPKTENSDTNSVTRAGLADISQSINVNQVKNFNPWFLFFTALATTIVLASFVLFIKLKFAQSNNPADRD